MPTRHVQLASTPCRVVDHGGAGASIVAVHGLGGSADNWEPIAHAASRQGRFIALDLPGFGLSGPARHHDLATHVAAVADLVEKLGGGPVTLVGNSMGGLVGELLAAARPELIRTMVLIAPATPLPPRTAPVDTILALRLAAQALPIVGPALTDRLAARVTPARQAEKTLALVAHRPELLPESVWLSAVSMAARRRSMPWAARAFSESARSVGLRLVDRSRHARMVSSITRPVTLIWGDRDRVVTPRASRWLAALRPDWSAIELDDVGHVPMLERPGMVVEALAAAVAA